MAKKINSVTMLFSSHMLFGPNHVIWTPKITLYKRKIGWSKITVEERIIGSLSKWTAHISTFGQSPFLRCGAVHWEGSKMTYMYRPNG